MRKIGSACSIIVALAFLLVGGLPAHAVDIYPWDWAFNVDGAVYEYLAGDNLGDVPDLTYSAFDEWTGLGSLTWTTQATGLHTFIAFFDHEMDEVTNTFWQEYGTVHNTNSLAAGQSWEIDEPGIFFGDIVDNVFARSLDNTNSVPSGLEDDVSMAMGWDFSLAANETATISLILDVVAPISGFYLSQTDPETGSSIYFSSTLGIELSDPGNPGPNPVPEPGTLLLTGLGLVGILGVGRRKASIK